MEPECRDRPAEVSPASQDGSVSHTLRYSYATCGNLDSYTLAAIHGQSQHRTFALTAMTSRPWSDVDPVTGEHVGIATDMILASLPLLSSNHIFLDGVSNVSESLLGTWDGCVHDIGIGVTDMCLGDFWVTSERLLLTSFLPALYADTFWLVVPQEVEKDLFTVLTKPFEPFSWHLWGLVLLFLVGSGMVLAFAEKDFNAEDFHHTRMRKAGLNGIYFVFMSYVSGGPMLQPKTVPGRLVTMGIGVFVVIALSTYTANLATFLITNSFSHGVQNLETALQQGKVLVMSEIALELLKNEYPSLTNPERTLIVPFGEEAKHLHAGLADVAVIPDSTLANMNAGIIVRNDCAGGPAEGVSIEDYNAYCNPTADGNLNIQRDCGLVPVGKALGALTVAVPVSERHHRAVAWAEERISQEGYYATVKSRYSDWDPAENSVCLVDFDDLAGRLPPGALLGPLLLAVLFVGTGGTIAVCLRFEQVTDARRDRFPRLAYVVSRLAHSCQRYGPHQWGDESAEGEAPDTKLAPPPAVGLRLPAAAEPREQDLEQQMAMQQVAVLEDENQGLRQELQQVRRELGLARAAVPAQAPPVPANLGPVLGQIEAMLPTLSEAPPVPANLGPVLGQIEAILPGLSEELRLTREERARLRAEKAAAELGMQRLQRKINRCAAEVQTVADSQWRLGMRVEHTLSTGTDRGEHSRTLGVASEMA